MTPPSTPPLPWVGLPTDTTQIGAHPFQAVGEKYLRAATDVAGVGTLAVPSILPARHWPDLLDRLDGLLLTGARSNIEPRHYGPEPSYEGNLHDAARDASTLGLIPMAIQRRLPTLAICRGLQEVNVALGGSLHQKVQEVPGLADHRERPDDPIEVQYGPAHDIELVAGGLLSRLSGQSRARVNSLHGQGIRRLAAGLVAEAHAPDGLIEAFHLADAGGVFLLAVQWHPEWRAAESPLQTAIFRWFGDLCRQRAAERTPPGTSSSTSPRKH